MPDRNELIASLEGRIWGGEMHKGGYIHVPKEEAEAILELLKEQEPRVLTLDEVEDALDTVVWVERPGDENLADGFGLIVMYSHKNGWVCIQRPFGEDPSEDNYDYSDYGKGWRCWSARPTDEQRKAVKWDAAD